MFVVFLSFFLSFHRLPFFLIFLFSGESCLAGFVSQSLSLLVCLLCCFAFQRSQRRECLLFLLSSCACLLLESERQRARTRTILSSFARASPHTHAQRYDGACPRAPPAHACPSTNAETERAAHALTRPPLSHALFLATNAPPSLSPLLSSCPPLPPPSPCRRPRTTPCAWDCPP